MRLINIDCTDKQSSYELTTETIKDLNLYD